MVESAEELGIDGYYRSFSAGATLYYAGAPATELYLIRAGRVQLFKRARGVERSIGLYGAEELVGEEALLPGAHRTATAQAIEPASALVIESDTFRALVRRRPELGERVMQQLVRRLQRTEEQLENFLLPDPTIRVLNTLLRRGRRRWRGAARALAARIIHPNCTGPRSGQGGRRPAARSRLSLGR